jgi:hypothetical protein
MAGGSAGFESAADPRLRIAHSNHPRRAEPVEMTVTATRKAEEECNDLDFFA